MSNRRQMTGLGIVLIPLILRSQKVLSILGAHYHTTNLTTLLLALIVFLILVFVGENWSDSRISTDKFAYALSTLVFSFLGWKTLEGALSGDLESRVAVVPYFLFVVVCFIGYVSRDS